RWIDARAAIDRNAGREELHAALSALLREATYAEVVLSGGSGARWTGAAVAALGVTLRAGIGAMLAAVGPLRSPAKGGGRAARGAPLGAALVGAGVAWASGGGARAAAAGAVALAAACLCAW